MPLSVVIIGGGQAGLEAAAALRTQKFDGAITLICEEPHAPYQRPPLSKDYLLGKQQEDNLGLRALSYYENHHIDLILGERAERIDRASKTVHIAGGGRVNYDYLILAVGARNRPLSLPGAERVLYLRTLDEARALRERLAEAGSVVVIGGGFIGLEVAAAARTQGKDVTVIEAAPRLMARAVSPVLSDFFLNLHGTQGVKVMLGASITAIEEGAVVAGSRIPADVIVAGIGVIPNTDLAAAAGLATGNGIVVDECLRTSDAAIFAIGDGAEHPNVFAGGARVRLESVQNAVDEAKCVAKTITGQSARYGDVPWFWTDQFDVRFQMAGLSGGHDQQILRGNIANRKFSVFYLKDGKLLAVDSVNRFGDHIGARKLLAAGVSPTPEQLADESVDLKKLV